MSLKNKIKMILLITLNFSIFTMSTNAMRKVPNERNIELPVVYEKNIHKKNFDDEIDEIEKNNDSIDSFLYSTTTIDDLNNIKKQILSPVHDEGENKTIREYNHSYNPITFQKGTILSTTLQNIEIYNPTNEANEIEENFNKIINFSNENFFETTKKDINLIKQLELREYVDLNFSELKMVIIYLNGNEPIDRLKEYYDELDELNKKVENFLENEIKDSDTYYNIKYAEEFKKKFETFLTTINEKKDATINLIRTYREIKNNFYKNKKKYNINIINNICKGSIIEYYNQNLKNFSQLEYLTYIYQKLKEQCSMVETVYKDLESIKHLLNINHMDVINNQKKRTLYIEDYNKYDNIGISNKDSNIYNFYAENYIYVLNLLDDWDSNIEFLANKKWELKCEKNALNNSLKKNPMRKMEKIEKKIRDCEIMISLIDNIFQSVLKEDMYGKFTKQIEKLKLFKEL